MSIMTQTRLDHVLEKYAGKTRTLLIEALHDIQEIFGYIPAYAAKAIANTLQIPEVEVYGVIEFYALLYSKPVSKTIVHVCNDPACALAGSDSIFKRMTQKVEIQPHQPKQELVTIEKSPCLGLCEHAPSIMVQGSPIPSSAGKILDEILQGTGSTPHTNIYKEKEWITQNCGCGHTTWLEEYLEIGGYDALQSAINKMPDQIIDMIKQSGLVGRGGAAFPTGIKWESAAKARENIKYLICNADEAEPGTFKDRVMIEDVPHRIIEGMVIAAHAIGAVKGYIYIRGEYRHQYMIMKQAIDEANEAGFLGKNILKSGMDFDIELRRGAGAYICGEETAQFESIEGKRGFPRIKPPYPTTHGLFGKPTVINNVETFCNIPVILQKGVEEYQKIGTAKSPGTKLFCLSGDVQKPGLYEVPMGIPFRYLLEDLAGGIRNGRMFQTALFGGAAGTFADAQSLDVPLSFEGLKEAGLSLGAGAIIVFDDRRNLKEILLRLGQFFEEESCGKCYPCQLGTKRQLEVLERINQNTQISGDIDRLKDIAQTMTDSSLCGLGHTASMAVQSALELWPEIFQPLPEGRI